MKAYPGLTEAQTEEVVSQIGKKRCGKCKACLLVEASKKMFAPNPPFSHANDKTIEGWNKVVYENPCEDWGKTEGGW